MILSGETEPPQPRIVRDADGRPVDPATGPEPNAIACSVVDDPFAGDDSDGGTADRAEANAGIATQIDTFEGESPTSSDVPGFDFDPAFANGRAVRIITSANEDVAIDTSGETPATTGPKRPAFHAAGDPDAGVGPTIAGIADANAVVGAFSTRQDGIDTGLGVPTTVANDAGTRFAVGSLGFAGASLPSPAGGSDVDGGTGRAIALLG